MKKEHCFSLIEEMKNLGITLQDFEKYWKEFEKSEQEIKVENIELEKIKEDAVSRFLGKIISTSKSSYLLVKDIDIHLHYSGTGFVIDFIGPRIDINILEENTISIHTWNSIYHGPDICGGKYTLSFDSIEKFDWNRIIIIDRDVFDSVIDQLQEKVRMFIDSLKDYFYEVKV